MIDSLRTEPSDRDIRSLPPIEPPSRTFPVVTFRWLGEKGRGVVATRDIRQGEVIERAPVILIPVEQAPLIAATVLDDYNYGWGEGGAIALGLGSLYNHSSTPNAVYQRDFPERVLEIIALRDIAEGEEVCVNYNGRPDDSTELVFQAGSYQRLPEPPTTD